MSSGFIHGCRGFVMLDADDNTDTNARAAADPSFLIITESERQARGFSVPVPASRIPVKTQPWP